MLSIGYDDEGDEHFIPGGDDPKLHKVDPLCGCGPDPLPSLGDAGRWGHHRLAEPETT